MNQNNMKLVYDFIVANLDERSLQQVPSFKHVEQKFPSEYWAYHNQVLVIFNTKLKSKESIDDRICVLMSKEDALWWDSHMDVVIEVRGLSGKFEEFIERWIVKPQDINEYLVWRYNLHDNNLQDRLAKIHQGLALRVNEEERKRDPREEPRVGERTKKGSRESCKNKKRRK